MVNRVVIEASDSIFMEGEMTVGFIKKDLGGTFTNVATQLAKLSDNIVFAMVEETNATGAGTRLYIKNNAGAFKYVALS